MTVTNGTVLSAEVIVAYSCISVIVVSVLPCQPEIVKNHANSCVLHLFLGTSGFSVIQFKRDICQKVHTLSVGENELVVFIEHTFIVCCTEEILSGSKASKHKNHSDFLTKFVEMKMATEEAKGYQCYVP